MAFMSKELLYQEAERLGLDIEGMEWHEAQSVVQEAIRNEKGEGANPELEAAKAEIAELKALIESMRTPTEDVVMSKESEGYEDPDLPDYNIIIAPEIKPTSIQLIKYDEELGQDLDVEEVYYDVSEHARVATAKDTTTGTYHIKGVKNRKVVAQSTIPKQNAGVVYNPRRDMFVRISDPTTGRVGYPWTHHTYQDVRTLLKDSGYYFKYKHLFNAKEHPENIWYAAGKMLVCDIDVVHNIFHEIELEESKKDRLGL